MRLKDFDEFEDAELLRQKLAASFVGIYRDLESSGEDPFETKDKKQSEIKPGTIMSAPSGQTIEWSNPPQTDGFKAFTDHTKLTLSIGMNVPYMLLAGDCSKYNYSSYRADMLSFYRYIEQLQNHILIPKFCDPVFKWFLESCELIGVKGSAHAIWTPPKKDLIDPEKDVAGYESAVKAGFMSHPGVIREMGEDPDDVYAEIEKTHKLFKAKNLVFSTDNELEAADENHRNQRDSPRSQLSA